MEMRSRETWSTVPFLFLLSFAWAPGTPKNIFLVQQLIDSCCLLLHTPAQTKGSLQESQVFRNVIGWLQWHLPGGHSANQHGVELPLPCVWSLDRLSFSFLLLLSSIAAASAFFFKNSFLLRSLQRIFPKKSFISVSPHISKSGKKVLGNHLKWLLESTLHRH